MLKIILVLQIAIVPLCCRNISKDENHINRLNAFLKGGGVAQNETTVACVIQGVDLEGVEAKVE